MITITNDYHGTSAKVRIDIGDAFTQRQIARVKRKLCGTIKCTCSDRVGARGKQEGFYVEYLGGTAWITHVW